MNMENLVAWLRAQLAYDEQVCWEQVNSGLWSDTEPQPPRWRDEIVTKRRILNRYLAGDTDMGSAHGGPFWNEPESQALGEDIVRLMTAPYADRPGYRKEWEL